VGAVLLASFAVVFGLARGSGAQQPLMPPPALGAGAGTATDTPSSEAQRAVMAVIQQANDEQQQAYSSHDPAIMRDTATASYYDELVQTQRDLENGGVSSIKLLGLEW